MARTKEFDPDAALQSALELFWRHGYEATSMADLTEHLGIGRASLYATFGSKHELYLKALDRYAQTQGPATVRDLPQPGPALPALRTMIERYAAETMDDAVRTKGCLITNCAAELAAHDSAAARRVEVSWEHLETALHSALVRAQAQGELPEDRDPLALARLLLVLLQGMRVVGKVSSDPTRVRDATEQALRLLG